jgi:ABC-2 type transport system ATP-binding protein
MPDSGEVILDGERLQRFIFTWGKGKGLYTSMKVYEQCLYLAQMKGCLKPEAKSN